MKRIGLFVLLFILMTASLASAQGVPDRVTGDTPTETQLALVAEAAPRDVVEHATIYILRKNGYEKYRLHNGRRVD